ncbi:MAG: hypothetical protein U9P07_01090 [Pseudomonadota bacterium]|nr:hypothetical protein [Pseudomonadota bacterium]
MFRHGSRSFSPAVHGLPVRAARRQAGFRGARRESHRVIRSAVNTAMSQARTSSNMPWQCKSES